MASLQLAPMGLRCAPHTDSEPDRDAVKRQALNAVGPEHGRNGTRLRGRPGIEVGHEEEPEDLRGLMVLRLFEQVHRPFDVVVGVMQQSALERHEPAMGEGESFPTAAQQPELGNDLVEQAIGSVETAGIVLQDGQIEQGRGFAQRLTEGAGKARALLEVLACFLNMAKMQTHQAEQRARTREADRVAQPLVARHGLQQIEASIPVKVAAD